MNVLSDIVVKTNQGANKALFSPQSSSGDMTARTMATEDLPALNGFTNAVPVLTDTMPYYKAGSGNRDCLVGEHLGLLEGYIQGCKLEYVDTNTIRVTPGMAQIQSSGKVLKLSANSDTDPSLSASTWYHVYMYDSSGAAVEVSTTAPNTTPWIGTARSKNGDTSRRYLGSFRTNSSSEIENFLYTGSGSDFLVLWRQEIGAKRRALAAGTAITNTNVSLADHIPIGCRTAYIRLFSNANQGSRTDSDDMTATDPDNQQGYAATSPAGADIYFPHPVNSSQNLRYSFLATITNGGGMYIDVYGYFLER